MLKISVIICTYNRERFIAEALQSMVDQTLAKEEFEVIVVDNNSRDRSREVAQVFIDNHPDFNFRLVQETNQGLSWARNRGTAESRSPWISYIDDDAIAEPDFLKLTVDYLTAHPHLSAVGGKIFVRYVDGKPDWMSEYISPFVGHYDLGDTEMPFPKGKYPRGSNMTISKNDLDTIGGFDNELGRKGNQGLASEEKDLFERLRAAGKQFVYLPKTLVHHTVEETRLNKAYYKNQARGYGRSEAIRSWKKGFLSWIKKLAEVKLKFIAGLILGCGFILQRKVSRASMLIYVQWQIVRGFFNL